jgi:DUF4097 and DUF4098 domain-containing protein YvlB
MKTMKIVTAFVLTMIFSGHAIAQQQAADQKQQLVVPLSEPGKPFKLTVGLLSGSIKVTGYEGKDVVIDVTGEDNKRKSKGETSNGMKRITAGNGMDVSAEEKGNSVVVRSHSWNAPVHMVIKVPQGESKMKLSTNNDGDITVSNVSGELEINNLNGDVSATGVSGSVVATTLNGDVVIGFKTIDPKAAMAFSTLNGKIDVTFPVTLKANVKLKSDQGEIYSDFDVDADKTQPIPSKSANGGTYRVKIDNTIHGKIGGGGPEMMMKNMNGNIYIRKAK